MFPKISQRHLQERKFVNYQLLINNAFISTHLQITCHKVLLDILNSLTSPSFNFTVFKEEKELQT